MHFRFIAAVILLFLSAELAPIFGQSSKRMKPLASLKLESISFSPDGRVIYVTEEEPTGGVSFWDVAQGKFLSRTPTNYRTAEKKFSDDGKYCIFLSSSGVEDDDSKIQVVEIDTGKRVGLKDMKHFELKDISSDGRSLWGGERGNPSSLLIHLQKPFDQSSVRKNNKKSKAKDSSEQISLYGFAPGGKTFVTLSFSRPATFALWNCNTGEKIANLPGNGLHRDEATVDFKPCFSMDGTKFYIHTGKRVQFFDTANGKLLGDLEGQRRLGSPSSIRFSRDCKYVFGRVDFQNKRFNVIWYVESGKKVAELEDSNDIDSWAFPNKETGLRGIRDNKVRTWNVETGKVDTEILIPKRSVDSTIIASELDDEIEQNENLAISSNGRTLAFIDKRNIFLWDISSDLSNFRKIGPVMGESPYVKIPRGAKVVFDVTKVFFEDKDGNRTIATDGYYSVDGFEFFVAAGKKTIPN